MVPDARAEGGSLRTGRAPTKPRLAGGLALQATSVSAHLADGHPGGLGVYRVHSRYRRVVNLTPDDPEPATPADLVTLAEPAVGNLPNGALVPGLAARLPGILPGTGATWDRWVIRLGGTAVHLEGATRWEPTIVPLTERAGLGDRLREARALLEARAPAGGLVRPEGTPLARAGGRVAALVDALEARDAFAACRAAEGLVGLGWGLTPSGDDLLVGLLAALWGRALKGPQRAVRDALAACVRRAAVATGDVSACYLHHAAAGRVTERLRALAAALVGGGDLEPAMASALAVGSTSGADGVLGLLNGLALWRAAHERRGVR